MNPTKIFEIMDLAQRARRNGDIFNPLFVGPPGLGKTEIVQQWCKSREMKSITLTSATLEAPDVRGFPIVSVVNGRQVLTTATPDFWPTEGEGVVILEEVNRGTQAVMNCWMALTDARRGFDNYTLPPGWIVVGCINPEDGEYDVNTMDAALKDRFEMFHVKYDKKSFIKYMNDTNWDKTIINFVEANQFNYKTPEELGNAPGSKYISPRTLSKVNTLIKATFNKEDELELYQELLGRNVAKDFYSFKYDESPVMMVDIDKNLKASLKKLTKYADPNNYKNGMISLTVKDIVEENTITEEVLVEVLQVIGVEQGMALIRELEIKRSVNGKPIDIFSPLVKKHKVIDKLFKSTLKYGK